jgi:hypothetical protein
MFLHRLLFLLFFFVGIFPDSQTHAVAKVTEHRAQQTLPSPDAPWDGYDYLVALSARIQHMRSVDRHLADLPDAAIQVLRGGA